MRKHHAVHHDGHWYVVIDRQQQEAEDGGPGMWEYELFPLEGLTNLEKRSIKITCSEEKAVLPASRRQIEAAMNRYYKVKVQELTNTLTETTRNGKGAPTKRRVVKVRGKVYVVVATRTIKRGNRAGMTEYTLAPLVAENTKSYGVKYQTHEIPEAVTGTPEEAVQAAIERYRANSKKRENDDADHVRTNHEALESVGFKVGMEVLVRFRNSILEWRATESGVTKSGRILIRNQANGKTQWIDARHVMAARFREHACPVEDFSDSAWGKLARSGWAHFTHHQVGMRLERLLVAFDPADVFLPKTILLDAQSIHYDVELKIYWRVYVVEVKA